MTAPDTGEQLQVTSTATVFADHVLWKYDVHNSGAIAVKQFGVVTDAGEGDNGTSSLGWDYDTADISWSAGPTDPVLAPGGNATFSFTTPSGTVGDANVVIDGEGPNATVLGPAADDSQHEPAQPVSLVALDAPDNSAAAYSVAGQAGTSTGMFRVSRAHTDLTKSLTVYYTVQPNTGPGDNVNAVAGVEYSALSGSVTIPAGQTSAAIMVNPLAPVTTGVRDVSVTLSESDDYEGNTEFPVTVAINELNSPTPPQLGNWYPFPVGSQPIVWPEGGDSNGSKLGSTVSTAMIFVWRYMPATENARWRLVGRSLGITLTRRPGSPFPGRLICPPHRPEAISHSAPLRSRRSLTGNTMALPGPTTFLP